MKKYLSLSLALLLCLGLFAGCGNTDNSTPMATNAEADRFTFAPLPTVGINYPLDDEDPTEDELLEPVELDVLKRDTNSTVVKNEKDPVRYVMIYNPAIYDPDALRNPTLSTGNFYSQIDVSMHRGDGLTTTPEHTDISQEDINQGFPLDSANLDGDRAGSFAPKYRVGDSKYFYCYDQRSSNLPRLYLNFQCRYAGTYCNIWVYNRSITDSLAKEYGQIFDEDIYEQMAQTFGEPRYADEGGKVNLLYYPLPDNWGGVFCMLDLYASNEVTRQEIEHYGVNTDHAIVHIDSVTCSDSRYKLFSISTMAHEFQHLICGTGYFLSYNYAYCPSWINEAMSGYVEQMLFPGSKEMHTQCFLNSEGIRHGQSLYNFSTTETDIGVYGSVYMYSQYLDRLAGDDVFANFHYYWRNAVSRTLNDAEALANSVPTSVYDDIDRCTPYPTRLYFPTEEQSWLSKLTLHFYLDLLDQDDTDPEAFAEVDPAYLLYDQLDGAEIEGGGRIIIALDGTSYTIPKDADNGLIYIGLNKDFEVVTPMIVH